MPDALTAINTRTTPQSERADKRQVPNNAGGYIFQISDEARIHRFLTLGVEGGTYYVKEADLTKDNAKVVLAAAETRGEWLVERIVEISTAGRAPRQNPAIFALAAVSGLGDDSARKAALTALPAVCRTGYHLYLFSRYVKQFRGWGRGLRRAVGNWYLDPDVDAVAYQAVKYRQREGWSHDDLLRLTHPNTDEPARGALFDWITQHENIDLNVAPALVGAFERAQATTDVATWTDLIASYPISWEMLPDAALTTPEVWRALVAKGMPQTALMRQLPRLTRLGVLQGVLLKVVTEQLQDTNRLRKGRVHPVSILIAMKTYASGHSEKGSSSWTPVAKVIDALDAAFYAAYGTIEPAGKRTLCALDISGSMGWHTAVGESLTCREASAALALVTLATEPDSMCVGFSHSLIELPISPRQRLDDAVRAINNLPFGSTDCALPMVWADQGKREFDTFQVYTDNETWAGTCHPHQALRQYRERSGIDARLAVVALTPTEFSIADPSDPGMLDVSGFDSAVPNLLSDFSRHTV